MPVFKCSNGKWRVGSGPCVFDTKEKADAALKAIKAQEGEDREESSDEEDE